MNGLDENSAATTDPAIPTDLAPIIAAEAAIRSQMAEGLTVAAVATCKQLYAEAVARYCMAALGDVATMQRVTADIWERAEPALVSLHASQTIRAIVLGLARRRCAYALETAPHRADAAGGGDGATPIVSNVAQRLAAAKAARQLLVQLPPSEREILMLRYVNRLSYVELGAIWGIGEGEALQRLSRALVRVTAAAKLGVQNHG